MAHDKFISITPELHRYSVEHSSFRDGVVPDVERLRLYVCLRLFADRGECDSWIAVSGKCRLLQRLSKLFHTLIAMIGVDSQRLE